MDETTNEIIDVENQEEQKEPTSPKILDKIADFSGLILGLIFSTGLVGLALAFFLTFIPEIHFTFLHFLKCWAGVVAFPLVRGMLHTKF